MEEKGSAEEPRLKEKKIKSRHISSEEKTWRTYSKSLIVELKEKLAMRRARTLGLLSEGGDLSAFCEVDTESDGLDDTSSHSQMSVTRDAIGHAQHDARCEHGVDAASLSETSSISDMEFCQHQTEVVDYHHQDLMKEVINLQEKQKLFTTTATECFSFSPPRSDNTTMTSAKFQFDERKELVSVGVECINLNDPIFSTAEYKDGNDALGGIDLDLDSSTLLKRDPSNQSLNCDDCRNKSGTESDTIDSPYNSALKYFFGSSKESPPRSKTFTPTTLGTNEECLVENENPPNKILPITPTLENILMRTIGKNDQRQYEDNISNSINGVNGDEECPALILAPEAGSVQNRDKNRQLKTNEQLKNIICHDTLCDGLASDSELSAKQDSRGKLSFNNSHDLAKNVERESIFSSPASCLIIDTTLEKQDEECLGKSKSKDKSQTAASLSIFPPPENRVTTENNEPIDASESDSRIKGADDRPSKPTLGAGDFTAYQSKLNTAKTACRDLILEADELLELELTQTTYKCMMEEILRVIKSDETFYTELDKRTVLLIKDELHQCSTFRHGDQNVSSNSRNDVDEDIKSTTQSTSKASTVTSFQRSQCLQACLKKARLVSALQINHTSAATKMGKVVTKQAYNRAVREFETLVTRFVTSHVNKGTEPSGSKKVEKHPRVASLPPFCSQRSSVSSKTFVYTDKGKRENQERNDMSQSKMKRSNTFILDNKSSNVQDKVKEETEASSAVVSVSDTVQSGPSRSHGHKSPQLKRDNQNLSFPSAKSGPKEAHDPIRSKRSDAPVPNADESDSESAGSHESGFWSNQKYTASLLTQLLDYSSQDEDAAEQLGEIYEELDTEDQRADTKGISPREDDSILTRSMRHIVSDSISVPHKDELDVNVEEKGDESRPTCKNPTGASAQVTQVTPKHEANINEGPVLYESDFESGSDSDSAMHTLEDVTPRINNCVRTKENVPKQINEQDSIEMLYSPVDKERELFPSCAEEGSTHTIFKDTKPSNGAQEVSSSSHTKAFEQAEPSDRGVSSSSHAAISNASSPQTESVSGSSSREKQQSPSIKPQTSRPTSRLHLPRVDWSSSDDDSIDDINSDMRPAEILRLRQIEQVDGQLEHLKEIAKRKRKSRSPHKYRFSKKDKADILFEDFDVAGNDHSDNHYPHFSRHCTDLASISDVEKDIEILSSASNLLLNRLREDDDKQTCKGVTQATMVPNVSSKASDNPEIETLEICNDQLYQGPEKKRTLLTDERLCSSQDQQVDSETKNFTYSPQKDVFLKKPNEEGNVFSPVEIPSTDLVAPLLASADDGCPLGFEDGVKDTAATASEPTVLAENTSSKIKEKEEENKIQCLKPLVARNAGPNDISDVCLPRLNGSNFEAENTSSDTLDTMDENEYDIDHSCFVSLSHKEGENNVEAGGALNGSVDNIAYKRYVALQLEDTSHIINKACDEPIGQDLEGNGNYIYTREMYLERGTKQESEIPTEDHPHSNSFSVHDSFHFSGVNRRLVNLDSREDLQDKDKLTTKNSTGTKQRISQCGVGFGDPSENLEIVSDIIYEDEKEMMYTDLKNCEEDSFHNVENKTQVTRVSLAGGNRCYGSKDNGNAEVSKHEDSCAVQSSVATRPCDAGIHSAGEQNVDWQIIGTVKDFYEFLQNKKSADSTSSKSYVYSVCNPNMWFSQNIQTSNVARDQCIVEQERGVSEIHSQLEEHALFENQATGKNGALHYSPKILLARKNQCQYDINQTPEVLSTAERKSQEILVPCFEQVAFTKIISKMDRIERLLSDFGKRQMTLGAPSGEKTCNIQEQATAAAEAMVNCPECFPQKTELLVRNMLGACDGRTYCINPQSETFSKEVGPSLMGRFTERQGEIPQHSDVATQVTEVLTQACQTGELSAAENETSSGCVSDLLQALEEKLDAVRQDLKDMNSEIKTVSQISTSAASKFAELEQKTVAADADSDIKSQKFQEDLMEQFKILEKHLSASLAASVKEMKDGTLSDVQREISSKLQNVQPEIAKHIEPLRQDLTRSFNDLRHSLAVQGSEKGVAASADSVKSLVDELKALRPSKGMDSETMKMRIMELTSQRDSEKVFHKITRESLRALERDHERLRDEFFGARLRRDRHAAEGERRSDLKKFISQQCSYCFNNNHLRKPQPTDISVREKGSKTRSFDVTKKDTSTDNHVESSQNTGDDKTDPGAVQKIV